MMGRGSFNSLVHRRADTVPIREVRSWAKTINFESFSNGTSKLTISGAELVVEPTLTAVRQMLDRAPRPSFWRRISRFLERSQIVPIARVSFPDGSFGLDSFELADSQIDEPAVLRFPTSTVAADFRPGAELTIIGFWWESTLVNGSLNFYFSGATRPGRY